MSKIYYSKNNVNSKPVVKPKESNTRLDKFINMSVEQKINALMSLPKYLYDIDLIITTEDEIIETSIVGKNAKSLITVDNRLIPISEIVDIEVKNKRLKPFIVFNILLRQGVI